MAEEPQARRPRIDAEITARLDAYCRAERRTYTAAVNHLLDQALADYEAKNSGEEVNRA